MNDCERPIARTCATCNSVTVGPIDGPCSACGSFAVVVTVSIAPPIDPPRCECWLEGGVHAGFCPAQPPETRAPS